MKKQFFKNLFVKKRIELVEKSLFDKQVDETRKILVKDAIYDRFQQNETIPLDWVLEYNELIRKSNSQSFKTINVESVVEEVITDFPKIDLENWKNLTASDVTTVVEQPMPLKRQKAFKLVESKQKMTKQRLSLKEFNKAFRKVINLVLEEGYTITNAIKKAGLSSGSFYTKITDNQRKRLKYAMKKSRSTK